MHYETESTPGVRSQSISGQSRQRKDIGRLPEKPERVFSQDDAADAIFYIQKGKVKLTVVSRQGKEAVIAILGAGDFFGEGCLAGQQRRMASATPMSDCSLMRIRKEDVISVLHPRGAEATPREQTAPSMNCLSLAPTVASRNVGIPLMCTLSSASAGEQARQQIKQSGTITVNIARIVQSFAVIGRAELAPA
ncbi:MAG: cyclic nucleotide-binding domain-containing protein [Bryobacteraceae bacterium]